MKDKKIPMYSLHYAGNRSCFTLTEMVLSAILREPTHRYHPTNRLEPLAKPGRQNDQPV